MSIEIKNHINSSIYNPQLNSMKIANAERLKYIVQLTSVKCNLNTWLPELDVCAHDYRFFFFHFQRFVQYFLYFN